MLINKKNLTSTYRWCCASLAATALVATLSFPARAFISDELSGIVWQVIEDFLQDDLNLNQWMDVIQDFLNSLNKF